jgi:hypothetical protein
MNLSELLKRTEVKVGIAVVLLLVLVVVFMFLNKKDGFCRCNSLGSRVLCDEEHEKLKQLEGAL